MKEITRIHIAKVVYDIELPAKKELESYLKKLEKAADDPEVLADIEIRITELLQDQGVKNGDVITLTDLHTVQEKLGSPADFSLDDTANHDETETVTPISRRLYRDTDNALLGGVLSGLAAYTNTSVLLVRIIFIALLIISFGTMLIVYLLLWVLIPEATTNTEKLQLAGKPITLASLKSLADTQVDPTNRKRSTAMQSVICYTLGTLSALTAIATLMATLWGGLLLGTVNPFAAQLIGVEQYSSAPHLLVTWLLIISGLLATALFTTLAYAFFSKTINQRIALIIVGIIITGMMTSSSAVFFAAQFGSRYLPQQIQQNIQPEEDTTNTHNVLKGPFAFTHLVVDSSVTADVRYIVTRDTNQHMVEFSGSPVALQPNLTIDTNNAQATLSLKQATQPDTDATITIYGPELRTITTSGFDVSYHNITPQDSIEITAKAGTFELEVGEYQHVITHTYNNARIDLDDATVHKLTRTNQ